MARAFERLYALLTDERLDLLSQEANLPEDRISNLDRLYLAVSTVLDNLIL